MKFLAPVTEFLFLKGLPILRDVALVNKLPGVRGLAKVRYIDFPIEDQQNLKSLTGKNKATFFLPNHPEFFTDWMIDKYVLTRVSPGAACWAAGSIVNGMGKLMHRFWLNNNLIAQVPGRSQQGKDYSVNAALSGQGVLLHPEGQVNWCGNSISSLFPGAAEMAVNAYLKGSDTTAGFQTWLAPIVWKLRFNSDVTSNLLDECRYVENRLGLDGCQHDCPAVRVYHIYHQLAVRDYRELVKNDAFDSGRHLVDIRDSIIKITSQYLCNTIADENSNHLEIQHLVKKWLSKQDPSYASNSMVKRAYRICQRWGKLGNAAFADSHITQEEIAEHLKRIRTEFCKAGFQDKLNQFIPQAAGSRTAHIRAVRPLAIHNLSIRHAMPDPLRIMAGIRQSMQKKLDDLVAALEQKTPSLKVNNPFYVKAIGNINSIVAGMPIVS